MLIKITLVTDHAHQKYIWCSCSYRYFFFFSAVDQNYIWCSCSLADIYWLIADFSSFQPCSTELTIWNSQNCSMFPLAFVAGWLQGQWWGFISRNYIVWPTFFLMNVFIAFKGSHFWFYITFGAVAVIDWFLFSTVVSHAYQNVRIP